MFATSSGKRHTSSGNKQTDGGLGSRILADGIRKDQRHNQPSLLLRWWIRTATKTPSMPSERLPTFCPYSATCSPSRQRRRAAGEGTERRPRVAVVGAGPLYACLSSSSPPFIVSNRSPISLSSTSEASGIVIERGETNRDFRIGGSGSVGRDGLRAPRSGFSSGKDCQRRPGRSAMLRPSGKTTAYLAALELMWKRPCLGTNDRPRPAAGLERHRLGVLGMEVRPPVDRIESSGAPVRKGRQVTPLLRLLVLASGRTPAVGCGWESNRAVQGARTRHEAESGNESRRCHNLDNCAASRWSV